MMFHTSFESGTNGSTAVGEFSSTTLGGGTLVYSNTHPGDGTLGARFTQSGSAACYGDVTGFNSTSMTDAFVFYYPGAPTASTRIWECRTAVGISFAVSVLTGGTVRILDSATSAVATTTTTLVAGHFYRVEVDGFSDAAAGTIDLRLFDGAQTTSVTETLAGTAVNTRGGAITTSRVGITSATTFGSAFYVDSLQYLDGTKAALGPFSLTPGPVKVLLDDGTGTFPYDVSAYVDLQQGISITRGRGDNDDDVSPSTCTVTLDNTDGRFTPGNVTYNIDVGTGIRVGNVIGATTFWRFTGFLFSVPVEWPNGGKQTYTQVTAQDRLAKLERTILRQLLYDDVLALDPDGYYPMIGDADLAVRNWSDTLQHFMFEFTSFDGGTLEVAFDADNAPGNYQTNAPHFTRTTGCLRINRMNTLAPLRRGNFSFGMFFHATETALTAGFDYLAIFHSARDNANLALIVDTATGVVQCTRYDNDTGIAVDTIYGGYVMDGGMHQVTVIENLFGRTIVTDDLQSSFFGGTGYTSVDKIPVDYAYDIVIGYRWRGSISHFFWGATTNTTAIALTVVDGLYATGDFATDYVIQTALRSDVPTADIVAPSVFPDDFGSVLLFPINTEGMTAAEAMRTWVQAEDGLVFIDALGRVTSQTRAHRYDVAASVTLPAHKVGADSRFVLDDSHLVNDATVTTRDGLTWRYVDSASVAKYGVYPDTRDAPYTDVSFAGGDTQDAYFAAEAQVVFNSVPEARISGTTIDVGSLEVADQVTVMGLELGDRITITGLPTQAPASSVDLFSEGWTETIALSTSSSSDGTAWRLELNTSPGDHFLVWKLEDATYGHLDSTTILAY